MNGLALSAFEATLAGGVLWSLVTVMGVWLSPKFDLKEPEGQLKLRQSIATGVVAVFSDVIAGLFVDPYVMVLFKVKDMATVNIAGLAVGLVFWPVLPGAIQLLEKFSLQALGNWIAGLGKGAATK